MKTKPSWHSFIKNTPSKTCFPDNNFVHLLGNQYQKLRTMQTAIQQTVALFVCIYRLHSKIYREYRYFFTYLDLHLSHKTSKC